MPKLLSEWITLRHHGWKRQRDWDRETLYTPLFLPVANYLARLTETARANNLIHSIGPSDDCQTVLIQYTYNTIFSFVSQGNTSCRTCNSFGNYSNGHLDSKSTRTIRNWTTRGSNSRKADRPANILGYKVGNLPFRYLGLPLYNKPLRKEDWASVISRINERIEGWKAEVLSQGEDSFSSIRFLPTCRFFACPFSKRHCGYYTG